MLCISSANPDEVVSFDPSKTLKKMKKKKIQVVTATIVSYERVQDSYISYKIRVNDGIQSYEIQRRFSHFVAFHNQLKEGEKSKERLALGRYTHDLRVESLPKTRGYRSLSEGSFCSAGSFLDFH